MATSEPPEPPEVEYRRPAWVEPPADMMPGIVPVELVLARTPQRAIGLTGIRAYPTGFVCTLQMRLREDIPGEQSTFGAFNMFGDGSIRLGSSPTTSARWGGVRRRPQGDQPGSPPGPRRGPVPGPADAVAGPLGGL